MKLVKVYLLSLHWGTSFQVPIGGAQKARVRAKMFATADMHFARKKTTYENFWFICPFKKWIHT